MPLLSIILPIYNVKNYLERCYESIILQNYDDFEILLVDDGSNDGSSDLCRFTFHERQPSKGYT